MVLELNLNQMTSQAPEISVHVFIPCSAYSCPATRTGESPRELLPAAFSVTTGNGNQLDAKKGGFEVKYHFKQHLQQAVTHTNLNIW